MLRSIQREILHAQSIYRVVIVITYISKNLTKNYFLINFLINTLEFKINEYHTNIRLELKNGQQLYLYIVVLIYLWQKSYHTKIDVTFKICKQKYCLLIILIKFTEHIVKFCVYTGKPLLTRFLLRWIRFNTNYNLQPCPPIAWLNFDLTRFFKIKCGQKYDPHPSNTCHTV